MSEQFSSGRVRQAPIGAMRIAAKIGDLMKRVGIRNPPLTTFRLNNLLTNAVFDLASTRQVTGELPYSLEQGVAITVDWIARHG